LLLTEPQQRSREWFEARAGRLTASNFGAALGLSPHMSRQELWRQLTGRSQFAGNVATDWGTAHEAEAISAYEEQTGNIVLPASFVPWYEWSGCSPDGYVGEFGLIEVKCPFSQKLYEEWPDHYRAQVIGQLAFTDRKWCDCWCWTPQGGKLVERTLFQSSLWREMYEALWAFWQYVVNDVEPPRQAKFKMRKT
jgi:putative phage-type endonuclease